ncbi:S26 family signal peptidase [Synergistaceae bacterium OttesenSCG-928-I11]|nr:S26 family signal peptidase [Synergistaceae bacterium OttesenSCG-928-I11]
MFLRLLLVLCVIAGLLCIAYLAGYRLNLTKSLPYRIYRLVAIESGGVLSRGDDVVIDISQTNNPHIAEAIERRYVIPNIPMLKEIGGVPGDIVFLCADTLHIAGISTRMVVASEDSKGRELTPYPTPLVLSADQYWLVSDPERGYDSRYFGPIDRNAFTHTAVPIL